MASVLPLATRHPFGCGWGKREIPLEMSGGQAIRRILQETGQAVRADFEKFRTREEFYDTVADPGCLHNLIDAPAQQPRIRMLRLELLEVMTKTADHELENFQQQVIEKTAGTIRVRASVAHQTGE